MQLSNRPFLSFSSLTFAKDPFPTSQCAPKLFYTGRTSGLREHVDVKEPKNIKEKNKNRGHHNMTAISKQQYSKIQAMNCEETPAAADIEDKWQRDKEKWLTAIPECIQPLCKSYPVYNSHVSLIRHALASALPLEEERLITLFIWHGSGEGSWSGYPSYEQVVENLLLEYDITILLNVVVKRILGTSSSPPPPPTPFLEGVARLFCGWAFRQKYPNNEMIQLPTMVREILWEHIVLSTNYQGCVEDLPNSKVRDKIYRASVILPDEATKLDIQSQWQIMERKQQEAIQNLSQMMGEDSDDSL